MITKTNYGTYPNVYQNKESFCESNKLAEKLIFSGSMIAPFNEIKLEILFLIKITVGACLDLVSLSSWINLFLIVRHKWVHELP